jgi:formamidopyrimidine-DNA glycosylase
MPELPELEVYKELLAKELNGSTIAKPVFLKPYILKGFPKDYEKRFPTSIISVERRGKYLVLGLNNNLVIVLHLMRSGRIRLQSRKSKPNKFIACTMDMDGGRIFQLVEYGKEKMAGFYIAENPNQVPGFSTLGIEPFDSSLDKKRFRGLLKKENRRLKQFLTDQRVLAGIGNAYANEILWDAKLSPFSNTFSLSEAESSRLLESIRATLKRGIEQTRHLLKTADFTKENRQFMAVHGRKDEHCHRCGDTIRWVYTSKSTTYYCPTCQTGGKILKDRRTSRFLK